MGDLDGAGSKGDGFAEDTGFVVGISGCVDVDAAGASEGSKEPVA
jgi:hypothetical protein